MKLVEVAGHSIFTHRGRHVIDTNHAVDRFNQRNSLPKEDLDLLFKRMIDKFLNKEIDHPEEFLVYSMSLHQGLIVAYRKDKYTDESTKQFFVVTFLPPGKKNPRPGTPTITVEQYYNDYSDNLIIYINDLMSYNNTLLTEEQKTYDYETINLNGLEVILSENKIYDFKIPVVEIE